MKGYQNAHQKKDEENQDFPKLLKLWVVLSGGKGRELTERVVNLNDWRPRQKEPPKGYFAAGAWMGENGISRWTGEKGI